MQWYQMFEYAIGHWLQKATEHVLGCVLCSPGCFSLFRAKEGLQLRPDFTFSDEEYNTYACPWHNSLTAAMCSFRTAKALRRNAGSAPHIRTFKWRNSAPFQWHSQQLLDLGLMEPGQWF